MGYGTRPYPNRGDKCPGLSEYSLLKVVSPTREFLRFENKRKDFVPDGKVKVFVYTRDGSLTQLVYWGRYR